MSIKRKAFNMLGKARETGGFGFKDKVSSMGKKAYGFAENHPIATIALGGTALAIGGEASGLNESIGRQRVGEWLESKPELLEAMNKEAAVWSTSSRMQALAEKQGKGANYVQANPNRKSIGIIKKYLESNPEEMKYLVSSMERPFANHLMVSLGGKAV